MTEENIVEAMDIDSVHWGRGKRSTDTIQTKALLALKPGQAISVSHDGYHHDKSASACSLRSSLTSSAHKYRPEVKFSFAHVPDGRLGIACFAKVDQS